MAVIKRTIYEQTHGDPPDRACLGGSDDKWDGYLLGVEEAAVVAEAQLRGAVHSYEELRGWVTEALNLPGQPSGEARRALLNGLNGTTRTEDKP
jgi:hypothetical protein